ncbi:MAG: hypothetical protein ABEI98_02505 [Halorhabdus sp.]
MSDNNPTDDASDEGSGIDIPHPDETPPDEPQAETDEAGEQEVKNTDAEETTAGGVGAGIGETLSTVPAALLRGTANFGVGLFRGLSRPFPKSHAIWQGMFTAGLKGIKKTSGGDGIGLVLRANNEIDPQPVKWKPGDGEEQRPHWATLGTEEKWSAGAGGREMSYIGNVPVALFYEDDHARIAPTQCRISEAIDTGDHYNLYKPDSVNLIEMWPENPGQVQGDAMADGGQMQPRREIQLNGVGDLPDDHLVDLDAGDGYNGSVISLDKASDWFAETATSEEMQMQEQRGRIAESDAEKKLDRLTKLMIYAFLAIIAAAIGKPLVYSVFGGGGGSNVGSNLMPFMLEIAGSGVLPA